MSALKPQHNHPVVFRTSQQGPSKFKPSEMSDETFQRVRLIQLHHSERQDVMEEWDAYITRLAAMTGMDPVKADKFLKGPLRRSSYAVQDQEKG
jgi:hypothetical protein